MLMIAPFLRSPILSRGIVVAGMSDSSSVYGEEGPVPCRPSRAGTITSSARVPVCVFVVIACAGGLWANINGPEALPENWADATASSGLIVGLLRAPQWSFSRAEALPSSELHANMRAKSMQFTRGQLLHGFAEYPIYDRAVLDDPIDPPP